MKRLLTNCLLVALVSGVQAQETGHLTADEHKQTMKVLEMIYSFETDDYYWSEAPVSDDTWAVTPQQLPWNKWAAYMGTKHRYRELIQLLTALKNASVRPSAEDPDACEIVFRCRTPREGRFSFGVSSGVFDDEKHFDEAGGCTGFRKEMFCSLLTDVRLHLTDREGRPVYLDTEQLPVKRGQQDLGEEYSEAWFSLRLHLSTSWDRISGGHITVSLFTPPTYRHTTLPLGEGASFPCRTTLGGKQLSLDKADREGLVISGDDIQDELSSMTILYARNGSWYRPPSRSSFSGDVGTLLKLERSSAPSFGEWMRQKGIDPKHLKQTRSRVISDAAFSDEDTPWGKRINTGMYGDSLLLYLPAEEESRRTVATITIPVGTSEVKAASEVDETVCGELLAQTGQHPDPEYEVSADLSDGVVLSPYEEGADKDSAPRMDFPRPGDKIEEMSPIVYAICHTTAHNVLKVLAITPSAYIKYYAASLREGYAFGLGNRHAILSRQPIQWRDRETTEDICKRYFFLAGAHIAAYGRAPETVLEAADRAIVRMLRNCRCGYNLNKDGSYEAYMYFEQLLTEWEEFLSREQQRLRLNDAQ